MSMKLATMTMSGFLACLIVTGQASGASKGTKSREWTLQDTIQQTINYSPEIRREQETVIMQQQNVKQAKAGRLPKADIEVSGGTATLPVSRNE